MVLSDDIAQSNNRLVALATRIVAIVWGMGRGLLRTFGISVGPPAHIDAMDMLHLFGSSALSSRLLMKVQRKLPRLRDDSSKARVSSPGAQVRSRSVRFSFNFSGGLTS